MARNAHPEETVQKILDVATGLFMRQGYDDTSMQDIINHLGGLSKGAVYHHFASKEELFDAVVNRMFAITTPQKASHWKFLEDTAASQQADPDHRARDQASDMTGLEIMQAEHDPALVSAQLNAIAPITASFNPERNPKLIGMQFSGLMDSAKHVISAILAKGNADGSLKVKHPQQVAEVQMILANMWMYPLFARGSSEELRARVDVYMTILRALGIPLQDQGLSDIIASQGTDAKGSKPTPPSQKKKRAAKPSAAKKPHKGHRQ
ncbi:TetR family transcriptional regulator [Bombiscardovia nodaiensis]|uniref:TetR family transcriptional regulator n=1 Tax=Bombiscardovia nodaiensis TaxID=2932181 RepID=A0ABN6SDS1_9BIFI|nr:TetR family transcriptional regulator [Bombiscardovia nodaiensis]